MTERQSPQNERIILDERVRGVPPGMSGVAAATVGTFSWHPADGRMSLPVLTLDLDAFARNRDAMLRYVREQGVEIAPHAKTPMAPELAADLVRAGAWGTTVADIRQAAVMAHAGLRRLILANGVGGRGGAGRLAALLATHRDVELYLFVDSVAAADALAAAWAASPESPPLRVLVEVGAARGGARDLQTARAIIGSVEAARGRLSLVGVATYEGAVAKPTPDETACAQGELLRLTMDVLAEVRAASGDGRMLVLTAGGSVYFDRVVTALRPAARQDGATTLVLRSGSIFFTDHGLYRRHLAELDARSAFRLGGSAVPAEQTFRPALRVWAEVLSRPETGLAICGMGMRDVASDHGLPCPLRLFRDGAPCASLPDRARVSQLNDQHAFLVLQEDADVRVGDVIEFGISHPCTNFELYRFVFGIDATDHVQRVIPLFFG